jgi:HEAT repeat protein
MDEEQVRDNLSQALRSEHPEPRLALARAAQLFESPTFEPALRELAGAPEADVRAEAVRAMKRAGAGKFLPDLVSLLADRSVRESARNALLSEGELALGYLDRCLSDLSFPLSVRRNIPRTISRFPAQAAVEILVRHLPAASGGMVRYKILRGLGKLLADNPNLRPDRSILDRVEEHTLKQCFQLLAWRVTLQRGVDGGEVRSAPGGQLLLRLLRSKENYAIERLFRLLGLQHPKGEFRRIYRGLHSQRREIRANSRELLENLLPPRYRDAVLALVEDVGDEQRLANGEPVFRPTSANTEGVLRELVDTESQNLRALSTYHAAELGMADVGEKPIAALPQSAYLSGIREQAKSMLKQAKDPATEDAPAGGSNGES